MVLLSVLLSFCLVFTGCDTGKDPVKPDDGGTPTEVTVTLDKVTAKMTVGDALTLKATIKGAAFVAVITWSSTTPMVATVSDGTVTAVVPGTTSIVAEVGDKAAACNITVTEKTVVSLSLDARLDTQYNQVADRFIL